MFFSIAAAAGFFSISELASSLLSGGKIQASTLEFSLVSLVMVIMSIEGTLGAYYLSTSNSKWFAKASMICLPCHCLIIMNTVRTYGFESIFISRAVVGIAIIGFLITRISNIRKLYPRASDVLNWVIGGLAMLITVQFFLEHFEPPNAWIKLLFAIFLGATIYFLFCFVYVKKLVVEMNKHFYQTKRSNI